MKQLGIRINDQKRRKPSQKLRLEETMSQKIGLEKRKSPSLWWSSSMKVKPGYADSSGKSQQLIDEGRQEAEQQGLPGASVDSSLRLEQDRLEPSGEFAEKNTRWDVENFNIMFTPNIRLNTNSESKIGRKRFEIPVETGISKDQLIGVNAR